MPIYEYLCRDCNTVYQFFSRTMSPKAPPPCPKAPSHATLEKQMSGFAFHGASAKSKTDATADGPENPATMAQVEQLMGQMEGIDENDPRAMGRLMRRMSEITGEGMKDPSMEEAIRRLEGGEDPERVEELMDSAFQEGDNATGGGSFGTPNLDNSIYDM